jgi:uncharacterized integral membrane protein
VKKGGDALQAWVNINRRTARAVTFAIMMRILNLLVLALALQNLTDILLSYLAVAGGAA